MMANRKPHTRFRLVPKSTTLGDLHYALSFKTHASFGAHDANLNEEANRQWGNRKRQFSGLPSTMSSAP